MSRTRLQQDWARRAAAVGVAAVVAACSGSTAASIPATSGAATSSPIVSPSPAASAWAQAVLPPAFELAVMGGARSPSYTVAMPDTWHDVGGAFAVKYDIGDDPGPVLGVSVWDVGVVFRDPCHWDGSAYDPGPTVDDLVDAFVAQPTRHATSPRYVMLAGHEGMYLEWSVPSDLKATTWTNFDDCDLVVSEGHRNFQSWLGTSGGTRWSQAAGQVDRLWVLDVDGQRLVVDATYSPDTSAADRQEQTAVVNSLRFVMP